MIDPMPEIELPPPPKPLTFVPCQVCGEVEHEVKPNVWVIDHNMAIHFPNDPRSQKRQA